MSENENKPSQQIIELDFDINEVQGVSDVFFKESEEILVDLDDHILKLESHSHDEILLQGLFRKLHTLKGSAGAVPGGQLFGSLSHEFETLLDRLRKQKIEPNKDCIELFLHSSRLLKLLAGNLQTHREIYPEELSEVIELITRYGSFQITASTEPSSGSPSRSAQSENIEDTIKKTQGGIWLSNEQMASLMQLSSEFIVLKNSLQNNNGEEKESVDLLKIQQKQKEVTHSLHVLSDQFQSILEKAQKIALKDALSGLVPLSRQAAYELGKEVKLEELGFETEVDKSLAQDLNRALVHMIRNSLDHGIEKPDRRSELGKNPQGVLKVSVEEKSGVLHCEVRDDGQGLNRDRILQRALEKGLTNALAAAKLSEEEVFSFIFHPGFSTKEKITTMSGRGVGMDVVQNIVQKYGGHASVQSKFGEGSCIHLHIPIPRKVMVERCLLGRWQDFALAFPLSEVSHISSCNELQITEVDSLRFCQFSGRTVVLLTLQEMYQKKTSLKGTDVKTMSVVFLKIPDGAIGLLVDKIQYQTDLVIKSFGSLLKKPPGFKGNSVLTDDQVAYVVDTKELESILSKEAS